MKITPDLHGTNEQYRKARGTHKPFKFCARAWAKLRKAAQASQGARKHPWYGNNFDNDEEVETDE